MCLKALWELRTSGSLLWISTFNLNLCGGHQCPGIWGPVPDTRHLPDCTFKAEVTFGPDCSATGTMTPSLHLLSPPILTWKEILSLWVRWAGWVTCDFLGPVWEVTGSSSGCDHLLRSKALTFLAEIPVDLSESLKNYERKGSSISGVRVSWGTPGVLSDCPQVRSCVVCPVR